MPATRVQVIVTAAARQDCLTVVAPGLEALGPLSGMAPGRRDRSAPERRRGGVGSTTPGPRRHGDVARHNG